MSARRAAQRERELVAFNTHGNFVLRPGKRKANSVLACQKRTARQIPENRCEFFGREHAVAIIAFRQGPSGRDEGNGAGTFTPDLFQHGVIVVRADAKIAGDDLALTLFWQKTAKKAPAFVTFETFFPQWQ